MLTTSRVKQKRRKEEAEGTRDHRSQVFSVLTRTKRLSRQWSTLPSCLQDADESQTSTRQIKKVCQHNDLHIPSWLHGADKSHTNARPIKERSYNGWNNTTNINCGCAPRPTNDYSEKILITWTTHLNNKQGEDIQAKKTSTKNKGSSFKKKYNILLQRLE